MATRESVRIKELEKSLSAVLAAFPSDRTETFSLAEGNVNLKWPAGMSERSLELFKRWLVVITDKIDGASCDYSAHIEAESVLCDTLQPEPPKPPGPPAEEVRKGGGKK